MSGADRRRPPVVVVGVEESDSSRQAADWAAEVAAAWRTGLHLVHTVPAATDSTAEPGWLRELRDAALRTGVEQVESRIVSGSAESELTARSRDAGLVVVGSYGEGSSSGMLAGSVALGLVESAVCPIAVVRGTEPGVPPPRNGPVLVGTDAASPDDPALGLGASLAAALGCRLSVLHAWSDVSEGGEGLHRATASGTELAAAAVARLDGCLRAVRTAHPALPIERHVVDDTALRALLEHAAGARMVVVGHRRGASARGRWGSTSRGLVGFAPCPVVVT